MSFAEPLTVLKAELLQAIVPELINQLLDAVQKATPIHEVESDLWATVLKIGRLGLDAFLKCHGTGDVGPTVTLPDGQEVRRLEAVHARRYVSIFGAFTLSRTVYGTRAGQAAALVPLDNRLQLPASVFSYLLQDWDQALATEQAFGQVNETIARMLRLNQSVDSLEGMNRHMAEDVTTFRVLRPPPPPASEGEIVVVTADGKGVVIRGQGTPTLCGGQRPAGQRANQKRMATVGAVYTVDPYARSAEDVVAALFRDPDYQPVLRPVPQNKYLWASLPQTEPQAQSSIDVVFAWLEEELGKRNPDGQRPTVYVCDGQEALWEARKLFLLDEEAVEILDLLHVTPRLWEAAKLLHGVGSAAVVPFVRARLQLVLEGKVETVIRGLRRLAVDRALGKAKRKALQRICHYFRKNRRRMRYDDYLRQGYPIASGVIEGACRHLVKDRLERAGMHWTLPGAQAMLDLRSVYLSGEWQAYQSYRITKELERLYPHRHLVAGEAFFALAV